MKRLFLVQDGREAREHSGAEPFVVHPGNILVLREHFQGMDTPLVLFVQAEVQLCLLYKFIEDYQGDLDCYTLPMSDLVFASRFVTQERLFRPKRVELAPVSPFATRFRDLRQATRGTL